MMKTMAQRGLGGVLVLVALIFLGSAISLLRCSCTSPMTKSDPAFKQIQDEGQDVIQLVEAMREVPGSKNFLIGDDGRVKYDDGDWRYEVVGEGYQLRHEPQDQPRPDVVVYDSREGSWSIE